MDRTQLLDALRRDGAAFAGACDTAGLTAPVDACPGWTVADLLWHLTEVHEFWRTMAAELWDSPVGYVGRTRPADGELPALYTAGLADTVAVLTAADPAAVVWTWTDDHTAGWIVRRMAQETAVHRWDAEQAAGRSVPIEAELASDGIDEFLEHFLGDPSNDSPAVGGSVHLHCTDVAGEWTVGQGDDGFVVAREHAKGDSALRGAASDLLLVLWRRRPLSTVDVVGDPDVAARFVAHTNLA